MAKNLLWTITSLGCNPSLGRDGFEFGIEVSSEFVQIAKDARINKPELRARMNELAVEMIAHNAGYAELATVWPIFSYHAEFGVNQVSHPAGDGRWLSIAFDSGSLKDGAKGFSHNIDTSGQQSFLLAAWALYVRFLEMDID